MNLQNTNSIHEDLPVFMDLKNDFAFKYILGHERILIKLLNDVLQKDVVSIEYLPNEIQVVSEHEKRAIFDVLCKNALGETFLVEMQSAARSDMDDRLVYYGCSLIRNQLERGDERYVLNPVYVLCIANYRRYHAEDYPEKLLYSYEFLENETNELFGRQLSIHILEVPRVAEKWIAAETEMEKWCCLFGNLSKFAGEPADAAGFEELFAVSRVDNLDRDQIAEYKSAMLTEYEKKVIGEYQYNAGHKDGRAEGRAEGIAEGRAEGLTEGMSRGAEQMRESIKARLEKLGLSQELIDEALKS